MSVRLFNHQTGQLEDVSDDQVSRALASGVYGAKKGTSVPALDRDGNAVFIPAEEAQAAFASGAFAYESADAQRDREMRQKYGDDFGQEAAAFGEGAARALSFGASDWALQAAGVEQEGIKARQQYNPVASTSGELLGTAASVLAPGGVAGAAAKLGRAGKVAGTAAKVVGAPVRGVASLGLKAEKAVEGLIDTTTVAGKIAQKAAALGAGSAVEGAFYGAGQLVSEAALGDAELNAENLIAYTAQGAGAGLVGGMVLGGGMEAGSMAIKKALEGATEASYNAVKKIVSRAERTSTKETLLTETIEHKPGIIAKGVDKATDLYSAAAAKILDLPQEEIKQFLGKGAPFEELRKRATTTKAKLDDAAKKLSDNINTVREADDILELHQGAAKQKNISGIVKKGNEGDVLSAGGQVIQELRKDIAALEAVVADVPGYKARIKSLKNLADGADKAMLDSPTDKINESVFSALDDLKKDVGQVRKSIGKRQGKFTSEYDAEGIVEGMYEKLRRHLEVEDLYGAAASAQKEINADFSLLLDKENYRRGKDFFEKFGRRTEGEGWIDKYEANPGKLRALIDQLGEDGTHDERYIRDYLTNRVKLADTIARHYDLSNSQIKALNNMRQAAADALANLNDTQQTMKAIAALQKIEGTSAQRFLGGQVGAIGGGVLGYAVGGEEGAVAGAAAGAIARPGTIIRKLALTETARSNFSKMATIERASGGFAKAVRGAIESFFSTSSKPAALARRLAAPAVVEQDRARRSDNRDRDTIERIRKITRLASDTEFLTSSAAGSAAGFADAAPRTAQYITSKAVQAVGYLATKAPKPPVYAGSAQPMPKNWKPSKSELARYRKIEEAITNPASVLDSMRTGTLTIEQVDAVMAVYPKIYQQIVQQVAEQMASMDTPPAYPKRQQLSILLKVPYDDTMRRSLLSTIQASYGMEQAAVASSQQPAVKPTAKGMQNLDLANQAKTPTEKMLER